MHEFWETTTDVEVLRDELRRQGQFVRVFDERNTERILEAIEARAEIERLRGQVAAVLDLAEKWGTQATDYDADTETQIADGRQILMLLRDGA